MTRLHVERLAHRSACMVTLTYAPRFLPDGESLVPADLAAFRMRIAVNWKRAWLRVLPAGASPPALRSFAVGEYGGKFRRPHYHLIFFGADKATSVGGVLFADFVRRAWGRGRTSVDGDFSGKVARYVSGYVTKGWNVEGLDVLAGRHREFSLYPNRPGLGGLGVPLLLADLLAGRDGRELVAAKGDLPSIAVVGDRSRRLGGFLMDKLREQIGLSPLERRFLKRRAARELGREHRELVLDELLDDALSSMDFEQADVLASRLAELRAEDYSLPVEGLSLVQVQRELLLWRGG